MAEEETKRNNVDLAQGTPLDHLPMAECSLVMSTVRMSSWWVWRRDLRRFTRLAEGSPALLISEMRRIQATPSVTHCAGARLSPRIAQLLYWHPPGTSVSPEESRLFMTKG
jgi:hypothetical protein